MRLRHRVLGLVALVVLIILAGSLLVVERSATTEIFDRADTELTHALSAFRRFEHRSAETLVVLASALERNPSLRVILNTHDSPTLEAYVGDVQEDYRVDLILLTDPAGRVLIRTDGGAGEVAMTPPLQAALEGYQYCDYAILSGRLYQVAAVPLLGSQDLLEGSLLVGYRLDRTRADELASDSGGVVAFLSSDEGVVLSRDGSSSLGPVLSERLARLGVPRQPVRFQLQHQGRHFSGVIAPLGADPAARTGIALLLDIEPAFASLRQARLTLFGLGLVAFLAALAISVPVVGRVADPAEAFQVVFDAVGDGLISLDTRGCVRMLNPAAERLLGCRQGWARGRSLFEVVGFQVRDRTLTPEDLERTIRSGQTLRHEDALVLFRAQSSPLPGFPAAFVVAPMLEEKRPAGAVILFRDMTALREVHRRLLDLSRQAGMAEVATGVLHNVGNALTSVSVCAGLIAEGIQGLRLEGLSRAVALLDRPAEQLPAFLLEDPRGSKLPTYLQKLTHSLDEDRSRLIAEVARLMQHVDHIQEIVRAQQAHARRDGAEILETVPPGELVEEALSIGLAAAGGREVTVKKEYGPLPAVQVARHRVV
ncbi:MAG: cache domain-containing protein, partial [Candidatus Eremiobacterota bacterium]